MARQGYDLQLTRYNEKGWRATFYMTGMEHSITSATASAWEGTPWHATQRAPWEALRQAASRRRLRIRRQTAEHAVWRPRSAFSRHTGQTETTRRPSEGVRTPPERVSGMEWSCAMAGQP